MRVENWILYKHLYRVANDRPDLGGRSGQSVKEAVPGEKYIFYYTFLCNYA